VLLRAPSPPWLPLAKFFATVASWSAPYKLMDEMTLRLCDCHRRHPPGTRGVEREISRCHPHKNLLPAQEHAVLSISWSLLRGSVTRLELYSIRPAVMDAL
jgi:hypothetical protein